LVITGEPRRLSGPPLRERYGRADVDVLTAQEARRFVTGAGPDPRADLTLAWELLYRLEPELYERLIRAERLHPAVLAWLPASAGRIVEVGAGTGRLTMELLGRGQEIVAIEPAAPLREILVRKLAAAGPGARVRVTDGFIDALPVRSGCADLVVACSMVTPEAGHGADIGLAELERVCRPGGRVVIVWPNHLGWLADRGYQYVSFDGPMAMTFSSPREAAELASIFYPRAAGEVRRRGRATVPYEVLGVNPPRDLAFKVKVPIRGATPRTPQQETR
jgi:SAM-dependent methyltransferase